MKPPRKTSTFFKKIGVFIQVFGVIVLVFGVLTAKIENTSSPKEIEFWNLVQSEGLMFIGNARKYWGLQRDVVAEEATPARSQENKP